MRRHGSLDVEGLEARKLLTTAHPAAHLVHAEVVVPVFLNGTLTVNSKATSGTLDGQGNFYQTTPVAGVLGSVGKVQGSWIASEDTNGNPLGPDTLLLHNAKGSLTVDFPNSASRPAHPTGTEPIAQHVPGGTKAYAHATETGSIVLTKNHSGKAVVSLTLASNGS